MKTITTKKGEQILVDDDVYLWASKINWRVTNERGYRYAINGKGQKMHRIVLNIIGDKSLFADHIDHNTLNNQKSNIRIVTPAQNVYNTRSHKDSNSKYKGVSYDKKNKTYNVVLNYKNKSVIRTTCKCEYTAALIYNEAAKRFFGEHAELNVITFEDKVKMFYRGEIDVFPERN